MLLSQDGGNTFTDLTEDATLLTPRKVGETRISTRWSQPGKRCSSSSPIGGLRCWTDVHGHPTGATRVGSQGQVT